LTLGRALIVAAAVSVAAAAISVLIVAMPRRGAAPARNTTSPAPSTAVAASGRKIKARLYYVSEDGARLVGMERDVPFGEGVAQQAREIVNAQLASVADPIVSAIPPNTALRALFVTDRGEAYVDLTQPFAAAHTGGTTSELLSVYTIVNVLTANLPAITAVQLLIEGKEVDALAGHVDLRRPLAKNLAWVQ
jgi:spore germination protein GerM